MTSGLRVMVFAQPDASFGLSANSANCRSLFLSRTATNAQSWLMLGGPIFYNHSSTFCTRHSFGRGPQTSVIPSVGITPSAKPLASFWPSADFALSPIFRLFSVAQSVFFWAGKKFKIFNSVIGWDSVPVMHYFSLKEWSFEMFGHYKSVLKYKSVFGSIWVQFFGQNDVAVFGYCH